MIVIDGSAGEGGGQILRGSLALSAVTGKPFRIVHIRQGRAKPGLMRQHLISVRAAQRVCNARVEGDEIGSTELSFFPGPRAGGHFEFDIGSAGSTSLVLQAILPALATLSEPSVVVLTGGTHNPLAPTAEFFAHSLLPQLQKIGWHVSVTLGRHGFYPAGGGKLRVAIAPRTPPVALTLLERGERREPSAIALSAHIPRHVTQREREKLLKRLNWPEASVSVQHVESDGPGNVVSIMLPYADVCEHITAFGERGVTAERVAGLAAVEAQAYLRGDAPVGPHLCDQLLVPLALSAGGTFRATEWTPHSQSQKDLLAVFLGTRVDVEKCANGVRVTVG